MQRGVTISGQAGDNDDDSGHNANGIYSGPSVKMSDNGQVIVIGDWKADMDPIHTYKKGSIRVYGWDTKRWLQIGPTRLGPNNNAHMAARDGLALSGDYSTLVVGVSYYQQWTNSWSKGAVNTYRPVK